MRCVIGTADIGMSEAAFTDHGDLDRHVKTLTRLPSSTPYVTADQAALDAFMAAMAPQ